MPEETALSCLRYPNCRLVNSQPLLLFYHGDATAISATRQALTNACRDLKEERVELSPQVRGLCGTMADMLRGNKALKWVDAALAERDTFFIAYVKAQILAKMGDKAGAIAAAKHSSELATKANESGYVKLNADLISSLK